MGGGGSKSESESQTQPMWPSDVGGLRQSLIQPLTTGAMAESPFYSALANMYQGVMGQATPGVNPETSKTISNAVSGGLPMTTEAFMSAAQPYAQGAYPAYQSNLDMALGQAKESAGMSGNLRGSAGYEALGRGASSTTADFIKYLTNMAAQSYEGAAGRQMAAIPIALQAELQPYAEAGAAASGAGQVSAAQYPMMLPAMQMATAGMGPAGYSTSESKTAPSMCCFMFIMGEGEVINQVQDFKYSHFGYNSYVANGYRWMSLRLMPIIRKHGYVKKLIKFFITQPLSRFAIHSDKNDLKKWLYVPVGFFWCGLWSMIGRLAEYNSEPYQEMVKEL
jgi:hypothetical protein